MINLANGYLEGISDNDQGQWNATENGAIETDPTCVPIRFVLQDVQIHCNTDAQVISGFSEASNFYSNEGSEMNIFITEVQLGSADGFAQISQINNNIVVNDIYPGLVVHELAHALGLYHTYIGQGQAQFTSDCPDVWTNGLTWDSDGDGVDDTNIHTCWNNAPIVNGQDACLTTNFDPIHPCCTWANQDNNLMGGSAWSGNPEYAAITPCQQEIMLTDIGTNMCDYIGGIGCAPPAANIGLIPLDGTLEDDCDFCFHFESSMNDEEYRITFEQKNFPNPSMLTIYDSGWTQGPVGTFCINMRTSLPIGVNRVFNPGETYFVTLQVRNDCGLDGESIRVTIPPLKHCGGRGLAMKVVASPNPVSSILNIEYTVEEEGEVRMGLYDPVRLENSLEILHAVEQIGVYEKSVDLTSFNNGVYFLMYEHEGVTSFETIIKQ